MLRKANWFGNKNGWEVLWKYSPFLIIFQISPPTNVLQMSALLYSRVLASTFDAITNGTLIESDDIIPQLTIQNDTDEIPKSFKTILMGFVVVISIAGLIPIALFIYSVLRREHIARAHEVRRRQRIENFLRATDQCVEESPWQKAINSIPKERVEHVLCKNMFLFSWVSYLSI